MKSRIVILLVLCFFVTPFLRATDGCDQYVSPDEFRSQQKVFIEQKAELTKQESDIFFPVYFEYQNKKKDLNDQINQLVHRGKKENASETQYKEIIEEMQRLRVTQNELDEKYYEKFQKILSYRKIYLVKKAEMYFYRELLKNIDKEKGKPHRKKRL
ncbi:hypothetical protein EZS27_020595 [termite gut metagenome]|uniref:Periplasmic heavy metal sensor n=1 Tax=termite gut metagenome TaxID=433724 RepID=A0A5J4RAM2_9ZZZZ